MIIVLYITLYYKILKRMLDSLERISEKFIKDSE